MAVKIQTDTHQGNILIIQVKGKLNEEDYEQFVPKIEEMMRNGKIRILFILEDFDGWTPSAMWEDTKFGVKHFNDIDRLAIVGEKELEKGMAGFCKVFTTAEVSFFEYEKLDKARQWIGLNKE
jgi:hypothetical protein